MYTHVCSYLRGSTCIWHGNSVNFPIRFPNSAPVTAREAPNLSKVRGVDSILGCTCMYMYIYICIYIKWL